MKSFLKQKNGQAMLIVALSLGSAMLAATVVAGLLILFQLRQSTDVGNSAQAIFAADAGTEYALYDFYCQFTVPARCTHPPETPLPIFTNNATITVTCYDGGSPPAVTNCGNVNAVTAIAAGFAPSLTSRRAFFINLTAATTVIP